MIQQELASFWYVYSSFQQKPVIRPASVEQSCWKTRICSPDFSILTRGGKTPTSTLLVWLQGSMSFCKKKKIHPCMYVHPPCLIKKKKKLFFFLILHFLGFLVPRSFCKLLYFCCQNRIKSPAVVDIV